MNVKISNTELLAREGQPLESHLTNVGVMSHNVASTGKKSIKLVGQLHDAGKACLDWLAYLMSSDDGKKPHAIHGALILLEKMGITPDTKILAGLIKSHHGCLRFVHDHDGENISTLDECSQNVIELLGDSLQFDVDIECKKQLRQMRRKSNDVLDTWVLIKYLFSVLVDADWTDAGGEKINEAKPIDFYSLYKRPNDMTPDPLKDSLLEEVMESLKADLESDNPSNLYSITAPCGAGKTNVAAVVGSYIATVRKKKKIFYVGPLRSILTQNIAFFRKVFPGLYILQHLSNVTFSEKDTEKFIKHHAKLCGNWSEAPFIATTLVQFVDTFVSSHAGKNRKLHNMENSVVIIDEVQSLPENTLPYVLLFIKTLAKYFNVTFILMSATQPHFTNLAKYGINEIEFTELLPNHEKFFEQRKLAYFHNYIDKVNDVPGLIDLIREYEQSKLIVVNTTKTAYSVFSELKKIYGDGVWVHLSTRMTEAHKRRVLDVIEDKNNGHINIVSTQCIEAGVDIDRFVVISALAPVDSLIQRLGRCFRFGVTREGIFIVVGLLGSSPYDKDKLAITRKLIINDGLDLVDDQPTIIREYFGNTYSDENMMKTGLELIQSINISLEPLLIDGLPQKGMDATWNTKFCQENKYKAIPESLYSVSVFALASQDEYTLDDLKKVSTKEQMRSISPHFATMSLKQFSENGGIILENGIMVWTGHYDSECGIIPDVTS